MIIKLRYWQQGELSCTSYMNCCKHYLSKSVNILLGQSVLISLCHIWTGIWTVINSNDVYPYGNLKLHYYYCMSQDNYETIVLLKGKAFVWKFLPLWLEWDFSFNLLFLNPTCPRGQINLFRLQREPINFDGFSYGRKICLLRVATIVARPVIIGSNVPAYRLPFGDKLW